MQRLIARTAEMLERETDLARSYGILGSPSFVVDGEMFWGDDRLEEAMAWVCGTHELREAARWQPPGRSLSQKRPIASSDVIAITANPDQRSRMLPQRRRPDP